MSNKLKNIELAKACGVSRATIATWVKRGQLVKNSDDLIDLSDLHNKAWIEKKQAEGLDFDLNRIFQKEIKTKSTEQKKSESFDPKPKSEIAEIQKKKMQLEVKRLQKAVKLDQLKIEKMEGKLIPVDAVQHLFSNSMATISAKLKQDSERLANIFKSRIEIPDEIFVEILREINKSIDNIQNETRDLLIDGVDGIVDAYREVRNRGESIN